MNNPFEALEQRLANIEKILLSMQSQEQPAAPEQDKWFNMGELIDYLPDKPARATIYGLVHNRKIPFHKTSKSLRFRKSEVDAYLSEGRVKTFSEIEAESNNYTNGGNGYKKGNAGI